MIDKVQVKHAKRDDLYEIAKLLDESWRAEYRQIVSDDFLDAMLVEEMHTALLKRYDEDLSNFLMMLDENQLVGAAVFGKSFTEGYEYDGEISAIYLRGDYVGKGYGHRLFVETERLLCDKGHKNLVLDLLSDNDRALKCYLKHGYEKVADRTIKLGKNEYPLAVLRKKISWKIILETERLYLHEMTQADFPLLCKHLQDEEVMYAYEHPFSDEEVQEGIDKQFQRYERYGFGIWAVILKENGKLIGQCGLSMQPCEDRDVLEIGYIFQKAYWHKGYATEAAIACREYAFDKLGADEVFSLIRDTNIASQNVAKRNGMSVRRTFVKHYRGIDMSHYIFSVKKSERERID